jgi:hypothetical protein
MLKPEEFARENIDQQLATCGWTVQSRNAVNWCAPSDLKV